MTDFEQLLRALSEGRVEYQLVSGMEEERQVQHWDTAYVEQSALERPLIWRQHPDSARVDAVSRLIQAGRRDGASTEVYDVVGHAVDSVAREVEGQLFLFYGPVGGRGAFEEDSFP